jgi:hypothetical protein
MDRLKLLALTLAIIAWLGAGAQTPDPSGIRYTPRPALVAGIASPVLSLDGAW